MRDQIARIHSEPPFALLSLGGAIALWRLTFHVGPDLRHPRAWFTPESHAGTVAFLVFCILFRLSVENVGSYSQSLGVLGGVIVLLSWFWVVALVLLAAAELDRAIEANLPIGSSSPN